ncbi:unnamed protein product [Choristocarpus tenellus]
MDPPQSRQSLSPTEMSGAQDVLRRMSLNSPPMRLDNPRNIKRTKLFGADAEEAFAAPVPAFRANLFACASDEAPVKHRPTPLALDAPSPMPSWGGGKLREASAGDANLEAIDPSSFYPSFRSEEVRDQESDLRHAEPCQDYASQSFAPPTPRAGGGLGGPGAMPDTPQRRPGTSGGGRPKDSPWTAVREMGSAQASPVKKKGGGRWRLSGGDGRDGNSPLRANRNPFSPHQYINDPEGDTMTMPAPPPRQQPLLPTESSPMDTDIEIDLSLITSGGGQGGSKDDNGDEGR